MEEIQRTMKISIKQLSGYSGVREQDYSKTRPISVNS